MFYVALMSSIDHSIQRIKAFAKTAGLKPRQLALKAGLHGNSLRDFDSEEWNPHVETVRKLEAVIPDDFKPGEAA